ncbi:GDP-mannose pyrophosphatase NudK [Chryseolinea sp. H1M3-3]|uniref:GDP-mannose pyrophosphatase NudK n=1 Tax=Chryseolinea sp. H1M3-3 TaxID=3034144 RepID=UPI0023EAFDED|nr:GDP-mannose pyrophosphatase NudK [Chryseolinea sp. H1M3-3]
MENERVKIISSEVLSDNWYVLKKFTFKYQLHDGSWQEQVREAYDRGNGATILLYNKVKETVILTRQFRLPTFINGNPTGMLVEACAGLLDKENPEECIRRETEEETGYKINDVKRVFELYMSPGSVTEILYFFVAEYSEEQKVNEGGGAEHEHENIEVLELPLKKAISMMKNGEIRDAKTVILLQYVMLHGLLKADYNE